MYEIPVLPVHVHRTSQFCSSFFNTGTHVQVHRTPVPGTTTISKSVYPILLSFYPSFYHQVRSLMNLVVSQVFQVLLILFSFFVSTPRFFLTFVGGGCSIHSHACWIRIAVTFSFLSNSTRFNKIMHTDAIFYLKERINN